MEYVTNQYWSDGESFLDVRKLFSSEAKLDVYADLSSYFRVKAHDTSVVPEAPPLAGPVLPEKNKSLVEWREEIIAVTNAISRLRRLGGVYVDEKSLIALEGSMLPKGKPGRPKKDKPPRDRTIRTSNGHDNRRIYCVETGVYYDNAFAAAKLLGCYASMLRRSANSRGQLASQGVHWMYEGDTVNTEPREDRRGGARKKRQVIDVKSGIVYRTLNDAAKLTSTSPSQVSYNLNKYGYYDTRGALLKWADTDHTEPSTAQGEQSQQPSSHEDASPASLPQSDSYYREERICLESDLDNLLDLYDDTAIRIS